MYASACARARERLRFRECVGVCVGVCAFVLACLTQLAASNNMDSTPFSPPLSSRPLLCSHVAQFNNHGKFYRIQQDDTIEMEVDLESGDGELSFTINGRKLPNWCVGSLSLCHDSICTFLI